MPFAAYASAVILLIAMVCPPSVVSATSNGTALRGAASRMNASATAALTLDAAVNPGITDVFGVKQEELDFSEHDSDTPQAGDCWLWPDALPKAPAYSRKEAEASLIVPSADSYNTVYEKTMIKDSASFAKAVTREAAAQADGWGAKVKADLRSTSNQNSDSSTLTFSSYMRVSSTQPIQMQECPSLDATAVALLSRSEAEFKEKYGTHFVSGFYSIASASSTITIKTSSESEKQNLALELSASYQGFGVGAESSAKFSDALSNTKERMEINSKFTSFGVTGAPDEQDVKSVGEFISKLPTQYRSQKSSRGRAIFYPHAFCKEYQLILRSTEGKRMEPITLDARYTDDLFKAWAQSEYLALSFKRLMRRSLEAQGEVEHSDVYKQDFSPLRAKLEHLVYERRPAQSFTEEDKKFLDDAPQKIMAIAHKLDELQNHLRPTTAPTPAPTQDHYIKTTDRVYLRSCSIPLTDKSNKVYRSFYDDFAVMAPSWVSGATKDTLGTYKIVQENVPSYVHVGRVAHIESTEADYSMYCSAAFNVAFWKGVSPAVPWTQNNDRNWLIRKRDAASGGDPRIKFGEEVVISTEKEDYAIQVNGYQSGYKGLHKVACEPGYGGDLEKIYGSGSTQCFKFERA